MINDSTPKAVATKRSNGYLAGDISLLTTVCSRAETDSRRCQFSPVRAFRNVDGAPFFVARAKGAKIWDVDGRIHRLRRKLGPGDPRSHAESRRGCRARSCHPRLKFWNSESTRSGDGGMVCKWGPSIEKLRMVNSGTEATMSCIRLARAFTQRDKIIKFDGCYHGTSMGSW